MTSPIPRIPIDPDLTYPVVLKWANGRIKELPGSYLLAAENPESKRYYRVQYPFNIEDNRETSFPVVNERRNVFMV